MDGHYTISKVTKHDKTLIYFVGVTRRASFIYLIGVTRRASFNYFLTRLHLFDKLLNYDHVRQPNITKSARMLYTMHLPINTDYSKLVNLFSITVFKN
jgi:hypothetical protein